MTALSLDVPSPHIALYRGKPTTTSQDVAAYFGKEHRHVLRAIRDLIKQIAEDEGLPKIEQSSDDPAPNFMLGTPDPAPKIGRGPMPDSLNFELVDYPDENGQLRPAYRMDRDGFVLLAMGFTGKTALQFKIAYIEAFNRMEERLRLERQSAGPGDILRTGLENGRYLVKFEGQGRFSLVEVPMFSSVLDPHNEMQMLKLVRDLVDQEVLAAMMQAGIERLSRTPSRKVLK